MKVTTGIEYNCKIDVCKESGIVTVTKYNHKISSDLAKNFGNRAKETTPEQYQENKKKNIRKSAKRIMELVKHNAGQYKKANGSLYPPIFLTLTFKENMQDWDFANTEHTNFIKRLNYLVYGEKCSKLAYISVPELQNRGAIHYHLLFFNLPYIDKFKVEALWGHGDTNISMEDDKGMKLSNYSGESLAKYITKYMTKQFYSKDKKGEYKFYYDKETWEGKKIYFASKNLFKPQTFKISTEELREIDWLLEDMNFVSNVNTYTIDDEQHIFSIEEEYNLPKEKIQYLLNVLPYFKDRFIKKEFVFGVKNKPGVRRSMLEVGKNYSFDPYDKLDFSFGTFEPVGGNYPF